MLHFNNELLNNSYIQYAKNAYYFIFRNISFKYLIFQSLRFKHHDLTHTKTIH
jgi:hypothetical protein